MSAAPVQQLSPQDYLAFERQAETKHEYVGGEILAMTGASEPHNVIVVNLAIEIGTQFRGRPCRVYSNDMRVAVSPEGPFYYPDLVAVCAERQFLDGERDSLVNPEVVVEVLSPSAEAFDRGMKFTHYGEIPSLREILFVAQDSVHIEHFVRREDEQWLLTDHTGLEAVVELPAVGCRLELARVYDKVDL